MSLKELRAAKGLSQSQFSKASGVSLRMIQQYEQGIRDINGCHLKSLLMMCKVLECKLSDLITDTELLELIKEMNIK